MRVFTGDYWNGGTEANVYATLYGERGDTGVRQLLRTGLSSEFAKGSEDAFIVEAVSLGHLKRCIMGHDGTGPGQGWFLDKIVVKEMPKGMTYVFPCDRYAVILTALSTRNRLLSAGGWTRTKTTGKSCVNFAFKRNTPPTSSKKLW